MRDASEISLEASKRFLARQIGKSVKLAMLMIYIDSKLDKASGRITQLLAQDINAIINKYLGYLWNYIGGSWIAFFPAEFDERIACINAIAASQEILKVIDEHINPNLEKEGYQKIGARISINFGSYLVLAYDRKCLYIDIIGPIIDRDLPAIYPSIIVSKEVYEEVNIKDLFREIRAEPKLYMLSTSKKVEGYINGKALVYKTIDEINADEIKEPSLAIKEILRVIKEGYDKDTYQTIVTALMHFVLTKFVIPSERKVMIDDQTLDIVIPSSKVLREEPKNALILVFPNDSTDLNKLSRLQPNKENIWLIFGYAIDKEYDYRVYMPDQFGGRPLSSIINDIEEFLNAKNVKRFKILPS